ncbi:hypothetical protein F5883DRAFT_698914 [Diaporthe sp. PMI_573]|nr:hypothetical protein F5883DRAFT_698914 [Diaporthaceae sp. PMI_573]
MQFITVVLLALVAGVMGLPPSANQDFDQSAISSDVELESPGPCGPLMRKAVCCKKSIFSIIDTGCERATRDIHTGPELAVACQAKGKLPRCCIMGLLGVYGPCKPPHSVAKELGYFNDTEDDIETIGIDKYWDGEGELTDWTK